MQQMKPSVALMRGEHIVVNKNHIPEWSTDMLLLISRKFDNLIWTHSEHVRNSPVSKWELAFTCIKLVKNRKSKRLQQVCHSTMLTDSACREVLEESHCRCCQLEPWGPKVSQWNQPVLTFAVQSSYVSTPLSQLYQKVHLLTHG